MPNIEIDKREFNELTGKAFDDEKLVTEASFLGAHWHSIEGNVCEVETYPNRPDLLSVEGLARAYKGFFDIETGRKQYSSKESGLEVEKDDSVDDVRPVIAGAVIRDIKLSKKIINGLIQLQEKLHQTMGRRRDKLAIGLHDMEEIEPPFTYKAVEPETVSFKPLEYDKDMNLGKILNKHEKGKKYSWILEDNDKYPIIKDKEGKVLSFPPIINNQLTEVTSGTTDVFIDVTGKDKTTVEKALNILVTALAERGGNIESINVDGEKHPKLAPDKMSLDPQYVREVSGLDIEVKEIIEQLEKMRYSARKKNNELKIKVPCYRNDIMHEYDLIEDILISYRYNNIEKEKPNLDTKGKRKNIEETSQVIRDIMSSIGARESMTYVHNNKENLTTKIDSTKEDFVTIANPISEEYSALRNEITPSMLEVLKNNKHRKYPQKFFETGNVVVKDDSSTGASNKKKASFIQIGDKTNFTDAKEVLKTLSRDIGVELNVKEGQKSFYMDSRSGYVYNSGEKVGHIGQFSKDVLEQWTLDKSAAGFEIDLDKIDEILRN